MPGFWPDRVDRGWRLSSKISFSKLQVSQNGLDIVALLVTRMTSHFKPYLNTVLNPVIDRLGDSKESVREKSLNVIGNLMENVLDPQVMLEKMIGAFSHKNGKVREEMLCLIQNALNRSVVKHFIESNVNFWSKLYLLKSFIYLNFIELLLRSDWHKNISQVFLNNFAFFQF